MDAYITALLLVRKELLTLDTTVPEWVFCSILINNLENRYKPFGLDTLLRKEFPTFNELCAQLRQVERQRQHWKSLQYSKACRR